MFVLQYMDSFKRNFNIRKTLLIQAATHISHVMCFPLTVTPPASSSQNPQSSDSLKLGLAIGLPVGIVVVAAILGLALFCNARRRNPVPTVNTYSGIYEKTGGYVTTIVVKDGAEPPTIRNTSREYFDRDADPDKPQNSNSLASVV